MATVMQTAMEKMCDGRGAVIREIVKRRDFGQPEHHSLYLKNLAAQTVGLHHTVIYDPHTRVLLDSLTKAKLPAIIAIFYKHFTRKYLVDELCKQEDPPYTALNTLFPKGVDTTKMWSLEEDGSYRLTEEGASLLLEAESYIRRRV